MTKVESQPGAGRRPDGEVAIAGTRRITIADAAALCTALKVSLGDLLKAADPDDLEMLGL
jgi:hypothetical protein